MTLTRVVTRVTVVAALSAIGAFGQSVISAKAGVIHYVEGDATVRTGKEVTPVEVRTGGRYNDLKEGQELATTEGRAEVLLSPGVFLRMGEASSLKMISSRLVDTRLDLQKGVALVEVAELAKEHSVTLLVKDAAVSFSKTALVRLDAETGIRVYKGEVQVTTGNTPQILREGREMQFTAGNQVVKFDSKQGDSLYRWANRRAEYISMANIASANMAQKSGNRSMLMSSFPQSGGWFYNSYFGMMTYLPYGNGYFRSPFGYSYFGPMRVGSFYRNYAQASMPQMNTGGGMAGPGNSARTWNPQDGYYNTQSRSAGPVSLPPPSAGGGAAAAAPAAPVARGADAGTARGGSAGGGRGQ